MELLAPVLCIAAGPCLAAIRARHHKGWSLLEREVREEIVKPLDRTDRSLIAMAARLFLAGLVAIAVYGVR